MLLKIFIGLDLAVFSLLGGLNYLAFKNYWYWRYHWFDQPMHWLGGFGLGILGLIVYLYFFKNKSISKKADWKILLFGLFPISLFGIMWEGLEFKADKIHLANVYFKTFGMFYSSIDESLKDLLFNFIGALSAILLFLIIIICKKKK